MSRKTRDVNVEYRRKKADSTVWFILDIIATEICRIPKLQSTGGAEFSEMNSRVFKRDYIEEDVFAIGSKSVNSVLIILASKRCREVEAGPHRV